MELNSNCKVWYTKSKTTNKRGDFIDILIVDTNLKTFEITFNVPLENKAIYDQNNLGVTVIEVTRFTFDFTTKVLIKNGYKQIN